MNNTILLLPVIVYQDKFYQIDGKWKKEIIHKNEKSSSFEKYIFFFQKKNWNSWYAPKTNSLNVAVFNLFDMLELQTKKKPLAFNFCKQHFLRENLQAIKSVQLRQDENWVKHNLCKYFDCVANLSLMSLKRFTIFNFITSSRFIIDL